MRGNKGKITPDSKPTRRWKQCKAFPVEQLVEDYVDNRMSLDSLELKYRESSEAIRNVLVAQGIDIRSAAEQRRITELRKRHEKRQFINSSPGSAKPLHSPRGAYNRRVDRKDNPPGTHGRKKDQ